MFKLNQKSNPNGRAHWAWLLPILALSPLAMAAKGCNNSGTGQVVMARSRGWNIAPSRPRRQTAPPRG